MKYIIILLLFNFFITFSNSHKRSIIWEKPLNSEKFPFNFDNAVYLDYNYNMPYYLELFEIENFNSSFNVTLTEKVFVEAPFLELEKLSNKNIYKTQIDIQTKKGIQRDKYYLIVSFIPIRKNPVTGKIEKLKEFNINIKQNNKTLTKRKKSITAYAQNSVLNSGKWIKIKIKESGVYKITYQELIDMGIDNPANVKIFGNGGKMISKDNRVYRPDDLIENAIFMSTGSDGIFNSNDYILFYGEGPVYWEYKEKERFFNHIIHDYSNYSYYYVTSDIGNGKKIQSYSITDIPNFQSNSYDELAFHEVNDTNLLKSGIEWYGEIFDVILSYDFDFYFPNRIISDTIKLKYNLAARSAVESQFNIKLNNVLIDNPSISDVELNTSESYYAREIEKRINTFSNNNNVFLNFEYIKPIPSSSAYLNFIIINVRSNLSFSGPKMHFRDIRSVKSGNITQFTLSNANQNILIWDITDIYNIKEIRTTLNNNQFTFNIETSQLKEFIAFDQTQVPSPEVVGEVQNQNLHKYEKTDFIIIAHPDFIEQANRLAEYRRETTNLKIKIVTPEQIYNEFSSGKPDISALRDYIKMMYNKETNPQDKLKYLLLFGDGSFDNKSDDPNNSNYILTYQSENSIIIVRSYVSDDFFGMLDTSEVGVDGLLDIGIGRFPVQNVEEAENVVNKTIAYDNIENVGDWQNIICFIGDDENNNDHMEHANKLSMIIENNYPSYNAQKILLDAYNQEVSSTGEKYPDVNKAIKDRMTKGALIINYSGHGGELGLAHERIITTNDILLWDNNPKLPLFVTATCEFSRYDDKNRTSAGEYVILNPNGGSIASFTTTRIVYAIDNFKLNKAFYNYVFKKDSITNEHYRLGDIIRQTKTELGTEDNKRNFSLLGDPTIMLKYPSYIIKTDTINNKSVSYINDTLIFSDTIKAFDKITVKGHIQDNNGNINSSFNGLLYPIIYDKPKTIITLGNDDNKPYTFQSQSSIVYKGKSSVKNGKFSFSFIIPKDIMYNYGTGKISYYSYNNNFKTASGYFNQFIIGGTSNNIISDSIGPEISLYMNDENFVNGGITDENPSIYAILSDSSGINTVGNGIGHDLVAILDSNSQNSYILNDYYEAELDNYQEGIVNYKMADIPVGKHYLKLKVWDILNNSSEETIDFIVAESEELALERIFNYPNPFTEKTDFYFEHNQAYNELEILIQIFTVSGKLVKTIQQTIIPNGYRAGPIPWNGLDDFGDRIGRGVYIYRIKVRSEDKQIAEKFEKLVILK